MSELERKYMNLEELKDFLGVNHQTVYNFRRLFGLPYIKVGTTVRYDRDDVIAWMSEHRCVEADSLTDEADTPHSNQLTATVQ